MRVARVKLGLIMCVVVALCCGGRPEQLNVIIVAVDTLRPDHLGCYGYHRDTSPGIDRLAASGVLCERCSSHAPWTLPSFATVFTSLYPTQHGADAVETRMRTSFPTLAEILKEHGYATGAVVNAPALKPANGVDRGFDHYHMTPLDGRVADGTTRDALAWLDTIAGEPFFAFVHYFDPHLSYSPPPPYDKKYTVPYNGRIGYSFNLEGFSRVRDSMFVQMQDLTQADWDRIVGLYDGEIAFTDSAIAELMRGLDERNLDENTLIVFLSDHGEEFFEHGGFEHGHSLYQELIHVPLLFSLPGRLPQGVRLSRPVRLIDVPPTILDLLAIDPPPHFEGISIRPILEGKGQPSDPSNKLFRHDVSYAEALMHGREQKSITAYPWKLVYEMSTDKEALFNLGDDPSEMRNVVEDYPDRTVDLEDQLLRGLFDISDTWYVEISAGENHRILDIDVLATRGLGPGTINPYRLLDRNGHIVESPEALSIERSGSLLRLKDFAVKGSLTLAFKVSPPKFPVSFDVRIDGRSALRETYFGEDLAAAETMPVSIKPRQANVGPPGRPGPPPHEPYVLVWHERSRYQGATAIQLDEETKKELRALGYIQ